MRHLFFFNIPQVRHSTETITIGQASVTLVTTGGTAAVLATGLAVGGSIILAPVAIPAAVAVAVGVGVTQLLSFRAWNVCAYDLIDIHLRS